MYVWFTWLPPLPLFAISTKKIVSSFFILLFCLRHSTCVSSVCMCLCLWVIREQIYYCRNDVVLILTAAHFTRAMQCSMKFQCELNNKNNICLHFKKYCSVDSPATEHTRGCFFKLFTECNYRWMQEKFIFDTVAQSIFVQNCFYFPIDLSFLWFFLLLFGASVHIRIVVFVVYLACVSMQLLFFVCLN